MFRIGARNILSRGAVASRWAAPSSFKTTAVRAMSTAEKYDVSVTQTAEKDVGVMEKFGVVPLIGFGACAMFGKELMIMNEEFLLTMTFGAFFATFYVAGGQSIHDALDKHTRARTEKFNDVFDLMIAGAEAYQVNMKAAVEQVPVAEKFIADQRASYEKLMAYKNIAQRHAAREATITKLEQIHNAEEIQIAAKKNAVMDKSFAAINAHFENADAKLQTELINMSIDLIGVERVTSVEEDPVKRVASEVFSKTA